MGLEFNPDLYDEPSILYEMKAHFILSVLLLNVKLTIENKSRWSF